MIGALFDPGAELFVEDRLRPHWSQVGAIVFITFRTADSIPIAVIERWNREKLDWLNRHGYAGERHWSRMVATMTPDEQVAFKKEFSRCREDFLDTCHGACLLRRPELSMIVADALMHFDAARYRMGDFVVMPNHVHLLVAFATLEALKKQCTSWMHFTAREINRVLGRRGKFWQQEAFDHLVRSPHQYEYLRRYIAANPDKAGLKQGEFRYRSASSSFAPRNHEH